VTKVTSPTSQTGPGLTIRIKRDDLNDMEETVGLIFGVARETIKRDLDNQREDGSLDKVSNRSGPADSSFTSNTYKLRSHTSMLSPRKPPFSVIVRPSSPALWQLSTLNSHMPLTAL
jgi:hypothetical protein